MNNTYELTVLLTDEKDLKSVKEHIAALEGKITRDKSWGERSLSYSIKKKSKAQYMTLWFNMLPKSILELKKRLTYDEKLLRYLLLTDEPKKAVLRTQKEAQKSKA